MAAANGDKDRVLQKSRDLKFLTGFETKVGRVGAGVYLRRVKPLLSTGGTVDEWGTLGGLLLCTGALGRRSKWGYHSSILEREWGAGCLWIWWGRELRNRSCISVLKSEGYVSTGGPERTGRVLSLGSRGGLLVS